MSQKAIGLMLASTICFALMNSLLRWVNYLPTFELVFFRAAGSLIFCFWYLFANRVSYRGNQPGLLVLRGLVGVTSMALYFWSLEMIPVGTAISLRYLSPFFALILAVLFLKEKMKKIQWLFLVLAFVGVALVKGFDNRISQFALLVILGSAFFSGLVYFVIRKIGTRDHTVLVVTYFMIISLIVGGVGCLFDWQTPNGYEWAALLGLGVLGFYAQVFMTQAIQIEEANKIVPFKYAEVVFTMLAGWILFSEGQTWITLGGISLIVLALISNSLVAQKRA
ncbi:MAG: DMT family transporter [Saprospiraceae bacterium]|nr:DMT family transporter [Saprospiraceae bacterium]